MNYGTIVDIRGNNPNTFKTLTAREISVLKLILSGQTYTEIGQIIFRSRSAAKQIAHAIFKKFNVHCKEHLLGRAVASGLIYLDQDGVKRGVKLRFNEKTFGHATTQENPTANR